MVLIAELVVLNSRTNEASKLKPEEPLWLKPVWRVRLSLPAMPLEEISNAPVAVNDTYSTNQDTALGVYALFDPDLGYGGLLSNDTDADGDPLTVSAVGASACATCAPAKGTVVRNANNTITYTPSAGATAGTVPQPNSSSTRMADSPRRAKEDG